ncbi:MAG: hypothetical protein AAFP04_00460 [Myxococcota bacterium]
MSGTGPVGRTVVRGLTEGAEAAGDAALNQTIRDAGEAGTEQAVRDLVDPSAPGAALRGTPTGTGPDAALRPGAAPSQPTFINERHAELDRYVRQENASINQLARQNPQDPTIATRRAALRDFSSELELYRAIANADATLPGLREAAAAATGDTPRQAAFNAVANAERTRARAYADLAETGFADRGAFTRAATEGYANAAQAFRDAANTSGSGNGPWMAELRAATLAAARSGYVQNGANWANRLRASFGDQMIPTNIQMVVGHAADEGNSVLRSNMLNAGRAMFDEMRGENGLPPVDDAGWRQVVSHVQSRGSFGSDLVAFLRGIP